MVHHQLHERYVRGKQVICLAAMFMSLLGFILDAITYYPSYSYAQKWVQGVTVGIISISIFLFLSNRSRFYIPAFGILSYTILFNIFLTALYIHSFISFPDFTRANILSRDILFVIFYIVLTGFMMGRKHIIIQGGMLFMLVLYFITVLKEEFFVNNAPIYLSGLISFSAVLYFFVGSINGLIRGLEISTATAHDLKREEAEKKQRLIDYQHALLTLGRNENLVQSNIEYLYREICKTAVRNLGVSRVSVWTLIENGCKLVRNYLYELGSGNADSVVLEEKDFPRYFHALENEPVIAADDAAHHPFTYEFADVYLRPLSIVSMLDCPIVVDGKAVGVICCENQNTIINWSTEDMLFVQSLSVHISICYKNMLISELLTQVRQRNMEITEKSKEIEAINEELNALNEELITLNESLEGKVKVRTSELETQNKQLTEYAFINSHILRAPLARILGLAHLISAQTKSYADKELVEALIVSSNELDVIIRRISEILYDGNSLSRQDIQVLIDRTINKN